MNYSVGCVSDIGIRRSSNQDSACYQVAAYQGGKMAFIIICDGMGGFSKGEIASAEVVKTFAGWFEKRMPEILKQGFSAEHLREEWYQMAESENMRISAYADEHGIKMGTTLTAALFLDTQYYIIHVGDSRLYELRDGNLRQLTHDHTVTQREVDRGNLRQEDAELDPRQHILLQCLGAGREIAPDFVVGEIHPETGYLFCSDGFRHKYSQEEMVQTFALRHNTTKKKIEHNLTQAINTVKNRGETDNITAGLLVVTN